MTGKDLERTRMMPAAQWGDKTVFIPRPAELDSRTVDAWPVTIPQTRTYVSKRATPFLIRHRFAFLISGSLLAIASGVTVIVIAVGWWWFLGSIAAAALFVALLARITRGGPRGGRYVEVTTTTRVRVR